MPYIAGDNWVICDRCSFKYRRSECRKEWTGLLVCISKCWERKHPQLTLAAAKDDQSVQDARPDKSSTFGTTTVKTNASKFASSIDLNSISHIYRLTSIGITLDSGNVQWTFATADPSGNTVALNEELEYDVTADNTVYVSGDSEEIFLNLTNDERKANL